MLLNVTNIYSNNSSRCEEWRKIHKWCVIELIWRIQTAKTQCLGGICHLGETLVVVRHTKHCYHHSIMTRLFSRYPLYISTVIRVARLFDHSFSLNRQVNNKMKSRGTKQRVDNVDTRPTVGGRRTARQIPAFATDQRRQARQFREKRKICTASIVEITLGRISRVPRAKQPDGNICQLDCDLSRILVENNNGRGNMTCSIGIGIK